LRVFANRAAHRFLQIGSERAARRAQGTPTVAATFFKKLAGVRVLPYLLRDAIPTHILVYRPGPASGVGRLRVRVDFFSLTFSPPALPA
jgi:hypothetical protein